ncbi:hypothetical protein [Planktotalea sp.]|uniref:hypothetical protein n=1 Tax=Planktotalea sp. TaxID=2029877 RepID=UPI0032995632
MSELSASSMTFTARPEHKPFFSAKFFCKFIGSVFMMSAIGLWFAPGSSNMADVLLLKTGLTGILTICAMVAFLSRN